MRLLRQMCHETYGLQTFTDVKHGIRCRLEFGNPSNRKGHTHTHTFHTHTHTHTHILCRQDLATLGSKRLLTYARTHALLTYARMCACVRWLLSDICTHARITDIRTHYSHIRTHYSLTHPASHNHTHVCILLLHVVFSYDINLVRAITCFSSVCVFVYVCLCMSVCVCLFVYSP
jgi:hypothetical protein